MKYCTAKVLLDKLRQFQEDLKGIDIKKADEKRDGNYSIALRQLEAIKDNELELEVLTDPDNILRNIMMLAPFDKTDATTKK
jgi:hypothetical protein